jgi:hypothetical protein
MLQFQLHMTADPYCIDGLLLHVYSALVHCSWQTPACKGTCTYEAASTQSGPSAVQASARYLMMAPLQAGTIRQRSGASFVR